MKFSIRDILWLTAVAALALGWWLWWRSTPKPGQPVTGTVAVVGRPLANGRIYLHAVTDGQIVGALVVKGKYDLPRVPIGKYTVTVEGTGVPANYANGQAGLMIEVKDGTNQITFDLLPNIVAVPDPPRPAY